MRGEIDDDDCHQRKCGGGDDGDAGEGKAGGGGGGEGKGWMTKDDLNNILYWT